MIKVRKIKEDLITARPKGMSYEEYRVERKRQEKMLKDRLRRGFMVSPSNGYRGKGTLVGKVPQMEFVK